MTFLSYTELDFNNLEKLEINMSYNWRRTRWIIRWWKNAQRTKVKSLRYLDKEKKNNITLPNLKILIFQIKPDSDFSFLYDYFDFKFLYDIMDKIYTIEDKPGEV